MENGTGQMRPEAAGARQCPHIGLLVGHEEEDKTLLDNKQSEICFEGCLCNVFYITLLAGRQHGASVFSYRTAHGKENTLAAAEAPFPRPEASPQTAPALDYRLHHSGRFAYDPWQ